ncbi:hypothetical protein L916_11485 [Phytophthora nicotianae]|uniref:FYVE-type domain-containing protein n=1 Tax=Phytophthora nicotianae TaxID=4792 RepID=W2IQQ2_PHYNI|nr:hypothetical protein L916_11485 [Phytophthora nicotianae]
MSRAWFHLCGCRCNNLQRHVRLCKVSAHSRTFLHWHMPSSPVSSSVASHSYTLNEVPSTMHFPLPAGYFGNVQVSPFKREECNDIVRRHVNALLADEYRYAERQAQQQPLIQTTEWKFFRRMGDLKVYQRRLRGRSRQEVAAEEEFPEAAIAVERGNPSMLTNGSVSGTIEDMLYGMSTTTQEETMTGLAITHPPHDAVLLSNVEKSTVEDPLRSADLLWVLSKMPIINPRDVCYLKATGMGTDGNGKPYGYLVVHSVDIPECPPFDYRRTKVLRAKMFFSFLFRETTPGYVDVIGRGVYDLVGGELLKFVLPHATTALITAILKGASCGEAKKLTLLAFRHYDERRHFNTLTKKSVCSMCIRGNKGMLHVRLRSCDVCGVPICKNCRIKDKRIFTGTKYPSRDAVCCATCCQQAKGITGVRLGEPKFLVTAEFYSKNRVTSSSVSSGRSAPTATLSTHSLEASAREAQQSSVERDNDTGSLDDAGKSTSVTSSTVGDSCASFDFGVSFSSDRNSSEYRFKYGESFDEEPESGPKISADMLAELDDVTEETAQPVVFCRTASKRRPDNMFEWMLELQSSAEEAYVTAKANERLMKKSLRYS